MKNTQSKLTSTILLDCHECENQVTILKSSFREWRKRNNTDQYICQVCKIALSNSKRSWNSYQFEFADTRTCKRCKQEKSIDNFPQKRKNCHPKAGRHSYCNDCFYIYNMIRINKKKIKAIKSKGGKCEKCNQIVHPALYDFHHIDPSKKEFSWNRLKYKSWVKIEIEIAKCQLLCILCHRMIHIREELWSI